MNKGVNLYVEYSLGDKFTYITLDKDFHWVVVTNEKEEVISKTNLLAEFYALFNDSIKIEQLLYLFDLDLRYNLALFSTDLYFLVQQKCKCYKYYTYYLNKLAEILELYSSDTFTVSLPVVKFERIDYSTTLLKRKRRLEELSEVEELYQDSIHKSIFYVSRTKIVTMFGSLLKIKEWYEIDLSSLDNKLLNYYYEIIKMIVSIS